MLSFNYLTKPDRIEHNHNQKQLLCTPEHLILHLQSTPHLHINKALRSQLQKLLSLHVFITCSTYRVSTPLGALEAKSSDISKLKKTSRFSIGAQRRWQAEILARNLPSTCKSCTLYMLQFLKTVAHDNYQCCWEVSQYYNFFKNHYVCCRSRPLQQRTSFKIKRPHLGQAYTVI